MVFFGEDTLSRFFYDKKHSSISIYQTDFFRSPPTGLEWTGQQDRFDVMGRGLKSSKRDRSGSVSTREARSPTTRAVAHREQKAETRDRSRARECLGRCRLPVFWFALLDLVIN